MHVLNGNQELMNALLDLRYVTRGGFADFADVSTAVHASDKMLLAHRAPERGCVAAFRPGGEYARVLAERNTIAVVGDTVFVHGGVLPKHAEYGIGRINAEIRAWLRGAGPPPPWVRGSDAPIWTRLYPKGVNAQACGTVTQVLATLGARRMVVGHTVHKKGVTSYYDGRIFAIDVGLAARYGGPMEVFEIQGESVRPLREKER